ncbi:autotransporter domain-containing protein [Stenotrophomonas maltophilia]
MIHSFQGLPAVTLARRRTSATARRASLLALAVGLAISTGAQAVNTVRIGDGDWYSASLWSAGVPNDTNSDNYAYIDGHTVNLATADTKSWHVYLGTSADAVFGISGVGGLTTATATLGVNAGHKGIAIVQGTDASWKINYDIGVGHNGSGELSVLGGAYLYTKNAWVGSMAGSDGFVMTDGVGSLWEADTIYVGNAGTGRVQISNGGRVNSSQMLIGNVTNSEGLLQVAQAGSQLTTGSLRVGVHGQGEMMVMGGAVVSSDSATVGDVGGTGTVTVNNTASRWYNNGLLTVGRGGAGELSVYNGAGVYSNGLVMAEQGGTATLTIGNDGGMNTTGGQTVIGRNGHATATISSRFFASNVILGEAAGSQGLVQLSGPDGEWISDALTLGDAGLGRFGVSDGASATVTGSIQLASAAGSEGKLVVSNHGVLVVGDSTSLLNSISTGTGSGELQLAGGVLRNPGWLTVSSDMRVTSNSQLDAIGNLDIQGNIRGSGGLAKTGTGVLMLKGDNAFAGDLTISQGTLSLGGNQAAGNGRLIFADGTSLGMANMTTLANSVRLLGTTDVHIAGSDSVTFAGGVSGTASTVLEKHGSGELVLSSTPFAGQVRVAGGTVRAVGNALPTGNIEISSAGTFQTDTTRVLTYAGQLSGSGVLRQGRHYLALTGDSSTFSGTAWVSEGQLEVEGLLGGQVKLDQGAWLTGRGSVGGVQLLSGSVLSPGSATTGGIGQLQIKGDLSFDSSSQYRVDVSANGLSDHALVSGLATLGNASTLAVATDGDWQASTRYTVLTANGGVSGVFSGAASTLAFLDPALEYDANHVYLTMRRNNVAMPDIELAFPDVVVNPNQKAVAGAVEALGSGNQVYDAVVRLDVADVVPAFDSLSGEIHAANRGALLQNRFLHDGIDRHLDGAAMAGQIAPGVRAWVAGSSSQRRTDASAQNAGLRSSQHGLMAGAGWMFGDALELGVAAGQQQQVSRLAQRDARAETDSTEYGVYGQYRWQGLSLRAGVSRADYRTDSTRTAQVGSTLSEGLAAREDATGTTAFLRAGWSFGGPRLQLTPELELAQVRLHSDGAQERGGHSALQLDGETAHYRTGLAALRADWDMSGGQRDRAALTARVGWQAAGGDRLPQVAARFVEGTQDFGIAAAPLARRSVLAQLGVAVSPTDNSRLSLQMQGQRGDGQREVGAQLDLSVVF